jgi:oligopeptide/dipeptide ABC transporter ATP-binding protein
MPILEVKNLKTHFDTPDGTVKAVDGVSFSLDEGETLGIVGESGSGKSVTALSLMQLNATPPGYYPEGEILLEGRDLLRTPEGDMQKIRGDDIAMIFQDPMTCLNPVFTVGAQITEAVRLHQQVGKGEAKKRAVQVLSDVGIPSPEKRVSEYPHQFSGGMRQRAMIAMALSCNPKVLIADEPTTALDVTIQAQILELMADIQEKYGTAIVMITHDLGVVAQIADEVMVMYAGRSVEQGETDDIFYDSQMPYTWSLLRSLPRLDAAGESRLLPIKGQPPSLIFLPEGCNFSGRCPFVKDECYRTDPALEEKKPGHHAACILSHEELEEKKSEFDRDLGIEEAG